MQLHSAYPYLSSVHKADYLGYYLVHHDGGAYTYIKHIKYSWISPFVKLNESDFFINGYREARFPETARGCGLIKDFCLALIFYKIIGNCAYICKRNTPYTPKWFNGGHNILDFKFKLLEQHTVLNNRNFYKQRLVENEKSRCPIPLDRDTWRNISPIMFK